MSAISPPVDVAKHLGLAYHIAKSFARRARASGVDLAALDAEALYGLAYAGAHFEPSRGGKFSSYAGKCIEGVIRTLFTRHRRHTALPRDEDGAELDVVDRRSAIEADVGDKELVGLALSVLTPRQQEVVVMLYGLDGDRPRTPSQAAKTLGIGPTCVNQLHQNAIAKMQAWAERRGLVGMT